MGHTVQMEHNADIDLKQMARSATRASGLMKTLGHKDRLMILCHLADGEKSVGHIADLLEIPQSPLSQHLSRMRKEGLVETRREAQTIYYSLTAEYEKLLNPFFAILDKNKVLEAI